MAPRDERAGSEATSLVGSQRAGSPVSGSTQDLRQNAALQNLLCFSARYGGVLVSKIIKYKPVTCWVWETKFMP